MIPRTPTRTDIDRALRELAILWRPPDEKENAAGAGTKAALNTKTSHTHSTPARANRKAAV